MWNGNQMKNVHINIYIDNNSGHLPYAKLLARSSTM